MHIDMIIYISSVDQNWGSATVYWGAKEFSSFRRQRSSSYKEGTDSHSYTCTLVNKVLVCRGLSAADAHPDWKTALITSAILSSWHSL